jgi:hypothetical protein
MTPQGLREPDRLLHDCAAKILKLPVLTFMASHSLPKFPASGSINMNTNAKTWLQLYVDAMTEKDPYKRLALVRELRKIPRHDESDEVLPGPVIRPVKSRLVRRH